MPLISLDKQYKTRNGDKVRILAVDFKNPDYTVVAACTVEDKEEIVYYNRAGFYLYSGQKSNMDLIEVSPYENWKVDDCIEVSINQETWHKRHFAGVDEKGRVLAWNDGLTSFTTDGAPTCWEFARKP